MTDETYIAAFQLNDKIKKIKRDLECLNEIQQESIIVNLGYTDILIERDTYNNISNVIKKDYLATIERLQKQFEAL